MKKEESVNKPLRVALISRTNLFSVRGGDTIQMENTARALKLLGVEADIHTGKTTIDYSRYQLLHFFNLIRPASILFHIRKSKLPYVISPVYVDYSFYEQHNSSRLRRFMMSLLGKWKLEYAKSLGRLLLGQQPVESMEYLIYGHKRSMKKALDSCSHLLPNSNSEYKRLRDEFKLSAAHTIVPNAIETAYFRPEILPHRRADLVLCVARIEGSKNQLNLIRAIKGSGLKLLLIGRVAPNHKSYYEACRREAGPEVEFMDEIPHQALYSFYYQAKVHAMPSWFETTGLSNLEAGYCGCSLVMGGNGDEKEYFLDDVFYCSPDNIDSIRTAILKAATAPESDTLKKRIEREYTWEKAALKTREAYLQLIS